MEATAVVPEGRISPEDAVCPHTASRLHFRTLTLNKGLWTDTQIPPLSRIVQFAHAHDATIGMQLSHAGRKASTLAPWVAKDVARSFETNTDIAQEDAGGWPDEGESQPHARANASR
jgi:2,4-dienoyl-CoA reductase-like NADH-dependent reductase (Old Yellow Enzyme family)